MSLSCGAKTKKKAASYYRAHNTHSLYAQIRQMIKHTESNKITVVHKIYIYLTGTNTTSTEINLLNFKFFETTKTKNERSRSASKTKAMLLPLSYDLCVFRS